MDKRSHGLILIAIIAVTIYAASILCYFNVIPTPEWLADIEVIRYRWTAKQAVKIAVNRSSDEDDISALVKLNEPIIVKTLIELLQDQDNDLVRTAKALGQTGDRQAVEPLTAALERELSVVNEDRDAAIMIAKVLGDIGDVRAVEPLIAAMENELCILNSDSPLRLSFRPQLESSANVIASIAIALGKIGDKRAVKPLISAMEDEVRVFENKLIQHRAYKAQEDSIILIIKAAVIALRQIGDVKAVEPLRRVEDLLLTKGITIRWRDLKVKYHE